MGRERTGGIKHDKKTGKHLVRVTYIDALGNRHDLRRQADTKTEARELRKKLLRDLEDHGERIIDGEKLTFVKLADIYQKHKLQPPVYKGETRVSGLRSWRHQLTFLKPLVAHFGKTRIRSITHADIERYKAERVQAPTRHGAERTITGVNRELSLLRTILNYAKRSGWLIRNPFEMGESLISHADENRRERILTRDEEARLLAACVDQRAHLRPLLITAVDTGMRRGELLALKWSDVDLEGNLIRVRKTTTKTWEARTIGMTARVKEELRKLFAVAPPDPAGLVFGLKSGVKRSFATACRLADIKDFHLHDLRHTATTRMIQAGMPPLEVMKITGHKQMTTFLRYLNTDREAAKRAASALDEWHAIEIEPERPDLIN
ncbi:MAG: tyrosine-type recombinase/integrase [Blastocatellia bacterium]